MKLHKVLCQGNVKWTESSNGNVPPGAIQVGQTSSREPLYIGRVKHKGSLCVGKVSKLIKKIFCTRLCRLNCRLLPRRSFNLYDQDNTFHPRLSRLKVYSVPIPVCTFNRDDRVLYIY